MYDILNININNAILALPANDKLIKAVVEDNNKSKKSITNDNGEKLGIEKSGDDYVQSLIQLNHFIKTYYTFFNYSKLYENIKKSNDKKIADKFKQIALENKPLLADVDDKYVKNNLILDLFKQQSNKLK
ncbi:hypothetical protein DY124_05255 [Apilactobacillus micheneri]|uniref:hypothetical protein n=1 Tax=Apilactobacillus micheneri TaxID=1899430 RepID=UPI00112A174A|nr:hypothetical protein [Apilactobacillus micheneri]TPR43564.1 hypothetical protein DY124_05255 [Apilactobacillus micheneri]TPR47514.1 hypothetical protein DY125_05255 [Apilactobacillus micheneri]